MIDPDHLLEHADSELPSGRGAPRQTDLRRAVSTAYYALFHEFCKQVADAFVGYRSDDAWVLFYRSLDHGSVRNRCRELLKDRALPPGLAAAAAAFQGLQAMRHSCDYDPFFRISRTEAQRAIASARDAIRDLRGADGTAKLPFLAFLMLGKRP